MEENLTQVGSILRNLKTWLWTQVMRLRFSVDKQTRSQKTDTSKDYINSANAGTKKLSESWNYHCYQIIYLLTQFPLKDITFSGFEILVSHISNWETMWKGQKQQPPMVVCFLFPLRIDCCSAFFLVFSLSVHAFRLVFIHHIQGCLSSSSFILEGNFAFKIQKHCRKHP